MINLNKYREVKPGGKLLKRLYVKIVMIVFGRAFQAASAVDVEINEEFTRMPENFMMDMHVLPDGPHMIIGKNNKGKIRYMGGNPEGKDITLFMKIKNLEAAMLMFTFRESTTVATARDRLIVDGDLPVACGVVRIMNLLEVFLLPKPVAKLGVKRYPAWSQMSPIRKHLGRIIIYIRLITG